MLQQERFRQQRRDEVAGDEFAAAVDEEAPIGVAIPRNPDIGLLTNHFLGDVAAVLLEQRVRLVMRERPVDVETELCRLARELIEQQRRDESGHSAARIEHDGERCDDGRVDERHHLLDVLEDDVARRHGSRRRGGPRQRVVDDHVADLAEPLIAAQRQRAAPHHLDAVVLLRIVRRRDLRASFEAVVDHREVEHVRAEHAVVDDVGALLARALDEGGGNARRRDAHVARDANLARAEVDDEAAANLPRDLFVDFARVESADVVGLEDLRIDAHRVSCIAGHDGYAFV